MEDIEFVLTDTPFALGTFDWNSGKLEMMHLTKKKVRQASASDFDQDPWMLNTENGTVDLRTGTLRPHRPEDLLSKMIPLRYDQYAECNPQLRLRPLELTD